jgi:hypothetical protein
MRRFTQVVVIFLISCLLPLACGGGSGTADTPEKNAKAASSGGTVIDACTVLTADLVRSIFDIGEVELSFRPGSSKANPSCVASWPVPNAEEVKAESAKAMQDYMMAKVAGEKDIGPMPLPHLEHEVRLTFAGKTFKDAAAAQAAFDGLLISLKEGITAEAEVGGTTQKHTFRIDYDHEVEGVGEKAAWAPKLKQLSFVSGRQILHLTVNLGDPTENERLAIAAAKSISAAL